MSNSCSKESAEQLARFFDEAHQRHIKTTKEDRLLRVRRLSRDVQKKTLQLSSIGLKVTISGISIAVMVIAMVLISDYFHLDLSLLERTLNSPPGTYD